MSGVALWAALLRLYWAQERSAIQFMLFNSFVMPGFVAYMGLMLAGTLLGALFWGRSHYTGVPTTAGGVMLVALQIIVGMQMMLGFLAYDIAAVPRRPLHRLLVALKPGGDTAP